MTYVRRQDANQPEIIAAFERLGFSVLDLSKIGVEGVPDLAVSVHKLTVFVEVKTKEGKLSPGQIRWHRESKAWTETARNTADVERIAKAMKQAALDSHAATVRISPCQAQQQAHSP